MWMWNASVEWEKSFQVSSASLFHCGGQVKDSESHSRLVQDYRCVCFCNKGMSSWDNNAAEWLCNLGVRLTNELKVSIKFFIVCIQYFLNGGLVKWFLCVTNISYYVQHSLFIIYNLFSFTNYNWHLLVNHNSYFRWLRAEIHQRERDLDLETDLD